MPSLFTRVFGRRKISGGKHPSPRSPKPGDSKRRKKRRFKVESLEARQLLAVDWLANIEGVVFNDRSEDGLTGDDTRLAGVTVNLYRDGGDRQFDGGGADDVLVSSQQTNGAGQYSFDQITPGVYFVQQPQHGNLLQRPGAGVQRIDVTAGDARGQTGTIIDSFDQTEQSVTASSTGSRVDASSAAAPEALGSERDLFVELTSSVGVIDITTNAFDQNLLEFSSTATAGGDRIITWDGADGNPFDINSTGLGGVDLTDGGASTGLLLAIGADHQNGLATLKVFSDAGNSSTITVPIPHTGGHLSDLLYVPFDQFTVTSGAGADLTNVGAVELEISGVIAVDGQLDTISTVGPTVLQANFANLTPLSLGNFVWRDLNNNGHVDPATEEGVAGVVLNLFDDTDSSNDFTPGVDTFLDTTTTASDGTYRFDNLFPGEYVVQVAPVNFQPGRPLHNRRTSTGNLPTPGANTDVDNDDNGDAFIGQGVVSDAVWLRAGDEPITEDGDPHSNMTVDFGFLTFTDLAVVKSDNPDPVHAGDILTYTIRATNNGPDDASGVVVVDTLPEGVTFASGATTDGSLRHTNGVITVNIGDLNNGESATITVRVQVDDDTLGTINNVVEITGDNFDENPDNNRDEEPTLVNPLIDLAIEKSDEPDPAIAGESLVYTLIAENLGPSTGTGVVVTDILPDGVTFASATSSKGVVSNSGNVVTINLGVLDKDETATITITADIASDVTGVIHNTARVRGNETESDLDNNEDVEPTLVNSLIDLAIEKSDNPDPAVAGESLVYTLVASNNGPSTGTGVVVTDILPDGVTFDSATASKGVVSNSGNVVTVDLGVMDKDETATITITVDIASDVTGVIHNTARIRGNETESDLDNNEDVEPTQVNPLIDLAIDKSDDPDPAIAGESLVYTLIASNHGPSVATGVVVTDILPDGVTFDSATASKGVVSNSGNMVTIDLGVMDEDESATVTITVDIADDVTGVIHNTARIRGNEPESDLDNNEDVEPTQVNPLIDLAIDKSDDPDPAVAGESLVYTLIAENLGPSVATGVVVTDILPDGVTFASAAASKGVVSNNGNEVTVDLGVMEKDETATITITVDIASDFTGVLLNTARIRGNETESNLVNNEDVEPTPINPQIDLAIEKSDDPDPAIAGESLVYTLIASNLGPSTATGVVVTDILPDGVTFVSATASKGVVSNNGNEVTVDLGVMEKDETANITITVDIASDVTGVINNTAHIGGNEIDSNLDNNEDVEPTQVNPLIDLAIEKSDDPDPAIAGESLVYTLIASNRGPSTATGVVVTDTLPEGVTFNSANASKGVVSNNGNEVTVDLGVMERDETANITITVDIAPDVTGEIHNTAHIGGNEPEDNLENNEDVEPTQVNPLIDLAIEKSDDPDPAVAGESLVYTLIASNLGPSTATGVVVTDILPDGVTFNSANASKGPSQVGVSNNGNEVTIDLGVMDHDETATIYITVDIAADVTGVLLNTARIRGSEEETNLENNEDVEPTSINPQIDLAIEKSDDPDPAIAGQSLVYTLIASNLGPSTATGVVVADILPDGVTFDSANASKGVVSDNGNEVTIDLGVMEKDETATITITVDIAPDVTGEIHNTAHISGNEADSNLDNNEDVEPTQVNPLIDLAVDKSDDPDPAIAGQSLVYTLIAENLGPSTATGVVVTDILPDGVTFDSATASKGVVSNNGNEVSIDLGVMETDETATITITVDIAADVAGVIHNTAHIGGNEPESNLENNEDVEPTQVDRLIDLAIEKDDSDDPVIAGQSFTYSLRAVNDGPSIASGVVVTDQLPEGVSFDFAVSTHGSVTVAGDTVTADLGTLLVGETASIDIVVNVDPDAAGTLLNVAEIRGNETETNLENNHDEERTLINSLVDLAIEKSDSPDPVTPGESLTYTLIATNHGPSTATGVIATDTLPGGVSLQNADTSRGSISQSSGLVITEIGDLAPGETATMTITVATDADLTGTILNIAEIRGDQPESNLDNNRDDEPTEVTPTSDLAIVKSDTRDPGVAGQAMGYELVVSNLGPSDATGVVVVDTLPDGVLYRSAALDRGTINVAGQVITINLGDLAAGDSEKIMLSVGVEPHITGTVVNHARVSGNEQESNLDNNQDEEPTLIVARSDLAIEKADTPDPVTAGELLTYTLVARNNGPSDATGVQVTDALPPEVEFVAATSSQGSVNENGGVVVANLGDLPNGASATINISVQVSGAAQGTIVNTAEIDGDQRDNDLSNNRDDEPTEVNPVIDLSIDKIDTRDPAVAGQAMAYVITVTNHGPSDATGVVMTDVLPDGVFYRRGSASQGSVQHANGLVTANLGDLASGASATVIMSIGVEVDTIGTIINTAQVQANEPEHNLDNNEDQESTVIVARTDLAISKIDSHDPVTAGEQFSYSLIAVNNGPSNATGVIVTDNLPAEVEFVSASSSQGVVRHDNGVVIAELGNLANGASSTIDITVRAAAGARGRIVNTASITGNERDVVRSNNRDDEPTDIEPEIDLVISKSASADPVLPGDSLTYTLVVSNLGPSDATQVEVVDTLPHAVTFVSAATTRGSVSGAGNSVTADIGDLAVGESVEITIGVQVNADAQDTIVNHAETHGAEKDRDPSNNTALEPTAVDIVLTNPQGESVIAGFVYHDRDDDGVKDANENGIANVLITLTGTDDSGLPVNLTARTGSDGSYRFEGLEPGTYNITESQPSRFRDGKETQGTPALGDVLNDMFTDITLGAGDGAVDYNFGERTRRGSKNDFLAR